MFLRPRASTLTLALILAVGASTDSLAAAASPGEGAPFRLDPFTCEPREPDLAALPDGRLAAVWITGSEVRLQLFDAGLEPLGTDQRVNDESTTDPVDVGVAAASDGTLAVAWTGETAGLWVRTFDADGMPLFEPRLRDAIGAELDLVAAEDDTFVVVWRRERNIEALRFHRQGRVLGRFSVARSFDANETSGQPAVAALPGGRLAIAWHSRKVGFPFPFDGVSQILVDLRGELVGSPADFVSGEHPRLVAHPGGGFVRVWSRYGPVLFRAFDSSGDPASPEVVVGRSPAAGIGTAPDAAVLPDGTVTVVWEKNPAPAAASPLRLASLSGRRLSGGGEPLSPERTLGFESLGDPSSGAPVAVALGSDRVVVAGRHRLPPVPVDPVPCSARVAILARAVSPDRVVVGDRFEVVVDWHDVASGDRSVGHPGPQTADTGSFWFFQPDNLELIVKVVDGRTVNDHFWFFYGALSNVGYRLTVTDLRTGRQREYENPPGRLTSFADTFAFRATGSGASGLAGLSDLSKPLELTGPEDALGDGSELILVSSAGHPPDPPGSSAAGPCTDPRLPVVIRPGLCLQDHRFEVEVTWRDPRSGTSGVGRPIPINDVTGAFWFFQRPNVELVVKVLDARAVNGRFWVLYGSLTDVEHTLRIRHVLATPGPEAEPGDEVVFENAPFELHSDADITTLTPPAERPGGCVCPLVIAPVCGVDGVTYDNECFAFCEGWVPVAHAGACGDL